MSVAAAIAAASPSGWLARERILAKPGFNRWLVPPAALAIHLCIGMAYGLSVFWLPLSRALGISAPIACPGLSLGAALVSTSCDWRVDQLVVVFTLGIVVLGLSAALWGGWLERVGPRRAAVAAACCWCGGLAISAAGVWLHQLWMLWLGTGLIGGIGLGLGYISPVSTLIRWFPDRRGMATGMAIMGFGGGAMIGSPLANALMNHFAGPTGVGVWQTFLVLAAIYFVFMMGGALAYRIPPAGWQPPGWTPPAAPRGMITRGNVALADAHRTRAFWMIWAVLCLNVSAGIGVLALASPMLQEIFGGALIGHPELGFAALDPSQKRAIAGIAAGFAGLLSLFNIAGRFVWASLSDRIGRKPTYAIVFALGLCLYSAAPWAAEAGNLLLFVLFMCLILSMYGGGFATIPAYLADIFGTRHVGAIHGRLLTAWSTAGVIGPLIVGTIRQVQLDAGIPSARVYDRTLYILAAFLAVGFIANLLVRPLEEKWFIPDRPPAGPAPLADSFGIGWGGLDLGAALAWACVLIPVAYGVWLTAGSALVLFR